jgi:hypothetical protein
MSEQPLAGAPAPEVVQAGLRELARVLGEAPSLGPGAQAALAALLGEMADALGSGAVDDAALHRLADHAGQFARTVGPAEAPHPHSAAERVEAALLGLAARAPVVSGAARRFVEALANIGI